MSGCLYSSRQEKGRFFPAEAGAQAQLFGKDEAFT